MTAPTDEERDGKSVLYRRAAITALRGWGMRIATTSVRTGLAMTRSGDCRIGRAVNDRPYTVLPWRT